MPDRFVTNASPVIALHQLGQLQLLSNLLGDSILVPPAVSNEIITVQPRPDWLQEYPLRQPIGPQILRASLGAGESAAIALALELNSTLIVLDDRPARRLAKALGITVIGTLGLLLAAKRHGHVDAVRPLLDSLRQRGFYVSDALYDLVLRDAREF
ncbi:MAG: DUF3368 domain-containing protein [Anaerolineales bacterium]|nr:DUF3368 domain-containing protein [Anaerolineales bacterium]